MRRTRHVYLTPPLGMGPRLQGFVLAWRLTPSRVSPAYWEAYVVSIDDRYGAGPRYQWIPAVYLEPVYSDESGDDEVPALPEQGGRRV